MFSRMEEENRLRLEALSRTTASERAGLTPIEDGKHIFLECSACRKPLVDIWLTHPDMKTITTLSANCPFCGDKSYPKEISGVFHIAAGNGVYIYDVVQDDDNNQTIKLKVVK